jgi:hypothetical protein
MLRHTDANVLAILGFMWEGGSDVPNEVGLRARKWQFLTRFSKRPDIPLAELAELAKAQYKSYANPFEWVRDRIVKYYDAAHKGILEMYGTD